MTTARARTLAQLVQENGWTLGTELGVYEGATTDYLLTACPALRMVGVDVWLPIEGGPKDKNTGFSPKAADVIAQARAKAYEVHARHNYNSVQSRLSYIEMRTVEAAEWYYQTCEFPEAALDFVFVDASHVTADVVADVRAWLPLVRPGGMILGHDADWPAIQDALRELFGGCEGERARVQYYDGNVWGVRV